MIGSSWGRTAPWGVCWGMLHSLVRSWGFLSKKYWTRHIYLQLLTGLNIQEMDFNVESWSCHRGPCCPITLLGTYHVPSVLMYRIIMCKIAAKTFRLVQLAWFSFNSKHLRNVCIRILKEKKQNTLGFSSLCLLVWRWEGGIGLMPCRGKMLCFPKESFVGR